MQTFPEQFAIMSEHFTPLSIGILHCNLVQPSFNSFIISIPVNFPKFVLLTMSKAPSSIIVHCEFLITLTG